MIKFSKYQGAGNDFIMIDNTLSQFKGDKVAFAKKWCERRFGIGSDGMIFIENSTEADFEMDFYNPDGSQSFCGNGSRCAVQFVTDCQIIDTTKPFTFKAIDGIHQAIQGVGQVSIHMNDVREITLGDTHFFANTGSPHHVEYTSDLHQLDLIGVSRPIRYSDTYAPAGTNVNYVEELESNHIKVRTYERGVENETLACGTGVTACALTYGVKHQLTDGKVKISAEGGELEVSFKQQSKNNFTEVWLHGPADFVFNGVLNDL